MSRSFVTKATRQLQRARKRLRLKRTGDPTSPATLVLIMGSQRAGTKMILETLRRSPQVWTHDHRWVDAAYFFGPDPAYLLQWGKARPRLNGPQKVRQLYESSPARAVVIHAIGESQNTARLLVEHPAARVLWMFRNYKDVANSAAALWGDHQSELMRRVRDREWDTLKWRAEHLAPEEAERLTRLYREDAPPQQGAALYWYLRLLVSPQPLLLHAGARATSPRAAR